MRANKAFTLIEVSIVIVIIGLIVGGVLIGSDLIKVAQLRKAVSQLQSYDIAAGTFRSKYDYLPGDIPWTIPGSYGLNSRWAFDIQGNSDGNGILEGANQSGGNNSNSTFGVNSGQGKEFPLFWADMKNAELITDVLQYPYDAATCGGAYTSCFPRLNLAQNDYIFIAELMGKNYYFIGNWTSNHWYNTIGGGGNMLTPNQAWSMDNKMDDGVPSSGTMLTTYGSFTALTLSGDGVAADRCKNTATTYNLNASYANQPLCSVIIKMGINIR